MLDMAIYYYYSFVTAPHQPRLDWQMWFAALGSYNHNPWFVHLIYRLLHGQQEVLDLMGKNPFPDRPPRYIRANLYTYRYTTLHKNTSSVIDAVHNSRLVSSNPNPSPTPKKFNSTPPPLPWPVH